MMGIYIERINVLIIPLLLVLSAAVLLVSASSYSPASGRFPSFVGWIYLCLASLELLIQLKNLFASNRHLSRRTLQTATVRQDAEWIKSMKGFLWLALMVSLLYLAGFLIAVPTFVFAFLRISGRKTVRRSGLIAAIATACIYLIFERLLNYQLYPGALLQQ